MQETRKFCTTENWPIWATPKNLPFFKDEIYQLFSYSYGPKVPKWKCAHILLCKKYKYSIKLLKIADLQPPDWVQRKKNTLYITRCVFFTVRASIYSCLALIQHFVSLYHFMPITFISIIYKWFTFSSFFSLYTSVGSYCKWALILISFMCLNIMCAIAIKQTDGYLICK